MAFPATKHFSSDTFYLGDSSETVGDWTELVAAQTGGRDQFNGADDADRYTAFGDAYTMSNRAVGGADLMVGGARVGNFGVDAVISRPGFIDSGVYFAGDALDMRDRTVGGNDTLVGGWDSQSEFYGDASGTMMGLARGGADLVIGGNTDASGESFSTDQFLVGDGRVMTESSRGGVDILHAGYVFADDGGFASSFQFIAGDAWSMSGLAAGASDKIYGADVEATWNSTSQVTQYLIGDAYHMDDMATGGNDTIYGGSVYSDGDSTGGMQNTIVGDSYDSYGAARFGMDTLYGASASGNGYAVNYIVGDTLQPEGGGVSLSLRDLGGDFAGDLADWTALAALPPDVDILAIAHTPLQFVGDKLYGGDGGAFNMMIGDTNDMLAGDKGGADLLVGGGWGSNSLMIGDARDGYGATGGADRLVSGAGNDEMYGDFERSWDSRGGSDVFVFTPGNGTDTIHDFQPGVDRIDLSAFSAYTSMPHTYRALAASDRMEELDGNVLIHLDVADPASEANTLLIVGVSLADLGGAFYF